MVNKQKRDTFVGVLSEETSIDYTGSSIDTVKVSCAVVVNGSYEERREGINNFIDAANEFAINYNEKQS